MPPPSTPPDIWSAFHSCCYRHACAFVSKGPASTRPFSTAIHPTSCWISWFLRQGSELFVAHTVPFRCTGPWTINRSLSLHRSVDNQPFPFVAQVRGQSTLLPCPWTCAS